MYHAIDSSTPNLLLVQYYTNNIHNNVLFLFVSIIISKHHFYCTKQSTQHDLNSSQIYRLATLCSATIRSNPDEIFMVIIF